MPSQLMRKGKYTCIITADAAMTLARDHGASSSLPAFRFPCSSAGAALICRVRGGVSAGGFGVMEGAEFMPNQAVWSLSALIR